jgi:mannan endo-1,4-beta-mannosidase
MKTVLPILILFLLSPRVNSQDFFYTKDKEFYRGDLSFSFLGFSAYYLQWIASDSSKKFLVDKVFNTARENGIKVIRTWAFNSNDDSSKAYCIRYSPYGLREEGLRALDYIIYKAKQYNINLILTLENNFGDFGGKPQYLKWAKHYLTPITSIEYNQSDFFTDDSIRNWYKFHIRSILERTNSYTGVQE